MAFSPTSVASSAVARVPRPGHRTAVLIAGVAAVVVGLALSSAAFLMVDGARVAPRTPLTEARTAPAAEAEPSQLRGLSIDLAALLAAAASRPTAPAPIANEPVAAWQGDVTAPSAPSAPAPPAVPAAPTTEVFEPAQISSEPAVSAPTPRATAAPPSAATSAAVAQTAPSTPNARSAGLLQAMNDERAARGLAPLRVADDLNRIAAARTADMMSQGYFAHVSPTGDSWLTLLASMDVQVNGGGENLARVSGDATRSVEVAITHLMDSPTHRANILNSQFTEIGVSAETDSDGVTIFTTIFAGR